MGSRGTHANAGAAGTTEGGDHSGARPRPRRVLRQVVGGALSFGLVIVIFVTLIPKLTSAGVNDVVNSMTLPAWLAVTVAGFLNIATNLPAYVITLPHLRLREAAVVNTVTAAVSNTVPEGGAVSTGLAFAVFRSWGFEPSATTLSIMTTGIWTQFARYGITAMALVVFAFHGGGPNTIPTAIILLAVLLGAIGFFALLLWKERAARAFGRLLDRISKPVLRVVGRLRPQPSDPADPDHPASRAPTDMVERTIEFRAQLIGLIHDRWKRLTVASVISQLSMSGVLLVALRTTGVSAGEIGFAHIAVAVGASALMSDIAPTPGGLGVVEATLLAVLSMGTGSPPSASVAAGVVLYRFATFLMPILAGTVTYIFWRYNRSWRMAVADRAALEPVWPG